MHNRYVCVAGLRVIARDCGGSTAERSGRQAVCVSDVDVRAPRAIGSLRVCHACLVRSLVVCCAKGYNRTGVGSESASQKVGALAPFVGP